jgi:hypothetical protein
MTLDVAERHTAVGPRHDGPDRVGERLVTVPRRAGRWKAVIDAPTHVGDVSAG